MTGHTVTFVFADGRRVPVEVDEAEPVYYAARRQRVGLRSDCLQGDCATCRGTCVSGAYRLRYVGRESLTDDEVARREVLTCQMLALGDCVVEFAY